MSKGAGRFGRLLQEGQAFHVRGEFARAEACYRQILAGDPGHGDALYLTGALLVQTGRGAEAVPVLTRVLSRAPRFAPAHNALGCALRLTGDLDGALACHHQALAIDPKDANARNNLGLVYQVKGELAAATAEYRKALTLMPDHVEALSNMGTVLFELKNREEARAMFERSIQLAPAQPGARTNLGRLYITEGLLDLAEEQFRQALAGAPGDPDATAGLATVLRRKGAHKEARELLQPFIERGDGVSETILMAYADVSHKTGERKDAVKRAEQAIRQPRISGAARARLAFLAGDLYDKMGEYGRAFDHYLKANQTVASRTHESDECSDEAVTEGLIQAYGRDRLAGLPDSGVDASSCLFIVGMPRSGTSLVEQILSSHPRVFGAGELPDVARIAEQLTGRADARRVGGLTRAKLAAAARGHLKRLAEMSGGMDIVTDKMPHNFQHLGLISRLFPGARVIHCTRSPMDTCLSIFFQWFGGTHPYSYDLADIGHHYRQYRRLMSHWGEVLDMPMLEMRYADVVDDQEGKSREMIAFAGLPWDDACLRFFESGRMVKTASHDQANKPVYRDSLARWKHYEKHLGPLMEALGPELVAESE